jgi:hypothetical protein
MEITKKRLKQVIQEELNNITSEGADQHDVDSDYDIATQMIEEFNERPHFGDVQIGLDQGDYGLLYNAVITMETTEVKSRAFKDEVEVERDIYSKIQKLQSGAPGKLRPGSFLTDVRVTKGYGIEHGDPDTITIYIYPKQNTENIDDIEYLKSFLSLVSSISQEITGGDIAQRDLPGLKESIRFTKKELTSIAKEEVVKVLRENNLNEEISDFNMLTGPETPTVVRSYVKVMARQRKNLDKLSSLWDAMLSAPGDVAAAREAASALGLAASLASWHARKISPEESYPAGEQLKSAIESMAPPKRSYPPPVKKPYGGGTRERPWDRST